MAAVLVGAGVVAAAVDVGETDPAMTVLRRLVLQWHLTDACDNCCRHCYGEAKEPVAVSWEQMCEVVAQYRHLLDNLARHRGHRPLPQLTLSGGDPLCHDLLFPLLELLRQSPSPLPFALLCNARRLDAGTVLRLAKAAPRFVQLSLDGNRQGHDSLRGEGDYDRVVAAVRRLHRKGITVLLAFTARRSNYRQFPEVAALGRKLGVRRVWADRFIPLGGSAKERDEVLTPQETQEFVTLLAKSRRRRGFRRSPVAMQRALQFLAGDARPYRCQAGRELLTLLPDGTLVPCRRLPLPLGNVFATSMTTLYHEAPLLRELRSHKRGTGCEGCFYAELCGGGLRCLSQAVSGEWRQRDPGCCGRAEGVTPLRG